MVLLNGTWTDTSPGDCVYAREVRSTSFKNNTDQTIRVFINIAPSGSERFFAEAAEWWAKPECGMSRKRLLRRKTDIIIWWTNETQKVASRLYAWKVQLMAQEALPSEPSAHAVAIEAKPAPIQIDTAHAAVLVIDMQNDFGAKGGMFDRAGIDISMIQRAVAPTARLLTAARQAEIPVVYVKMGFQPDLSDAGPPDAPNWLRHLPRIGTPVPAPDGTATVSSSGTPGTRTFFLN